MFNILPDTIRNTYDLIRLYKLLLALIFFKFQNYFIKINKKMQNMNE